MGFFDKLKKKLGFGGAKASVSNSGNSVNLNKQQTADIRAKTAAAESERKAKKSGKVAKGASIATSKKPSIKDLKAQQEEELQQSTVQPQEEQLSSAEAAQIAADNRVEEYNNLPPWKKVIADVAYRITGTTPGQTFIGSAALPIDVGAKSGGKALLDVADDFLDGISTLSKSKTKDIAKIVQNEQRVTDLASGFGVNRNGAKQIMNKIDETPVKTLWDKISKPLKWGVSGVVAADLIGLWYGADNIVDGTKINLNSVVRPAVESGEMSKEKAQEIIESSLTNVNYAAEFINTSTRFNPILWPFRKLYMGSIEAKRNEINEIAALIMNSQTDEDKFDAIAEENREEEVSQRDEDAEFFRNEAEDRRNLELEQQAEDRATQLSQRAEDNAAFDSRRGGSSSQELDNDGIPIPESQTKAAADNERSKQFTGKINSRRKTKRFSTSNLNRDQLKIYRRLFGDKTLNNKDRAKLQRIIDAGTK